MVMVRSCLDETSLVRLVGGQLPEGEAAAVEEHLGRCPRCAAAYDQHLEPVISALRQTASPDQTNPDQGLIDDLVVRLKEITRRAPDPPASLPPETLEFDRLGPYRVLRVIGEGGMGTVYEGEDEVLRRRVALKVMKADCRTESRRLRFLREARAAATLDHESVVPVWYVGEQDGVPFLAMPLLQGETLAARLQREPRLPLSLVLEIGKELAAGLAAAHEKGLTHRDVKPANVWLEDRDDRPRVRLLDFGLARAEHESGQLTREGALLGTPQYMAPEQARGEVADGRADLFSLGCVLYELTTGCRPFDGPSVLSVLSALGSHRPRPPLELNAATPPELSRLIMRLVEKDPNRRPGTAADVANDLRRMGVEPAATVHAVIPRWRVAVIGALGAAGLAVALGVIIITFKTPDGRPYEMRIPDDRPILVEKNGDMIINPATPPTMKRGMPPPPSAGETIRDFVACHGLTAKEFDDWVAKLPEGYQLHWMDVRAFGKEVRFSGVATNTPGGSSREVRHKILAEDDAAAQKQWRLEKDWNETLARKFRMVWDWQYPDGDKVFRTRLYRKDDVIFSMKPATPDTISAVTHHTLKEGAIVQAITPNLHSGGRDYLVTMADTRRECKYSIDSVIATLPAYVRDVEARGGSLDQLTAYESNGAERFIVIASENLGKPARTVEWDVPHDKFAARIAEQKKTGIMPWCLTAYGSLPNPRYAVIWSPFQPEQK